MKKKATAIRIQIPEPCTEDFSKMHPLPGGHFCDKCERTVVDFRGMTDREIVRLYQQRQGRVCGVFLNQQLDRPLPLPQPPKEGRPWAAIAALTTALLLGESSGAQTAASPHFAQVVDKQGGGKAPNLTKTKLLTITGWVMDENDEPLPFATVATADGSGTVTELDGSFKLKISSHLLGTALSISYVGCETKMVMLEQGLQINEPIEVRLSTGLFLPEVVVTENGGLRSTNCTFSTSKDICSLGSPQDMYRIIEDTKTQEIPVVKNVIKITVFPNPFLATLNVEMDVVKPQPHLFHLYTEAGQLVFAESRELEAGQQTIQLNLAQRQLPEGMYFLRISDEVGEIRTKRLVKVSP